MRKTHACDSAATEASVFVSSHCTCDRLRAFNSQSNRELPELPVPTKTTKMDVHTDLRTLEQLTLTFDGAGLRRREISACVDIADTSGGRKAERMNAASIALQAAQLAIVAVFWAKMTRKANRSSSSRCFKRPPDECL